MITVLWRIAYSAGTGYFANRLSTSAAAMAFYTMFAIGPIMIFSIAIAEPFVGKLMAQQAIFDALGTVVAHEQLVDRRRRGHRGKYRRDADRTQCRQECSREALTAPRRSCRA